MVFEKHQPFVFLSMVIVSLSCLQDVYAGKICGPNNWGKHFYFAVPGHFYSNYRNYNVSYNLSLTIAAKENGNVTLLAKGQNISAHYGISKGKTVLPVPETVVQSYGQPFIQRKGIQIMSTTKISAKMNVAGRYFGGSWRRGWESFRGKIDLLPISTLSSKYTIPIHGKIGIHIVGVKKTGFTITYEKDGKRQVIEGKLRKFDSFLLNDTFPSGLNLISSDERVTLFFSVDQNYMDQYQYVKQVPAAVGGSQYIIPPDSKKINFRAVAVDNGTIIEVRNDSRIYNMMLNAGEYIQSVSNQHVIGLSSNKGIVVTRNYNSYYNNEPVIAPVPAVSLYCNGYAFDQGSYGDLTVVTARNHKDEFMFHERDVPWWSKVSYCSINGTEYFVAKMTLGKGDTFRKIQLRIQNATFGGFLGIHPLGTRG